MCFLYGYDTTFRGREYGNPFLMFVKIYRAKTERFEPVSMPNYFHALKEAVLLQDGRVLFAGPFCHFAAAELCENSKHIEFYDPKTNSFSIGPKMLISRSFQSMALLKHGRVLLLHKGAIGSEKPPEWTHDRTLHTEIYRSEDESN